MRRVHHTEPIVGHGFQRRNPIAHLVHEDLPATTGDGTKPGLGKIPDHGFDGFIEEFGEGHELAGAERVDVHGREPVPDV